MFYILLVQKKGQVDVLNDNMPCLPDNLAWADETHTSIYIACALKRTSQSLSLLDLLAPYPVARTGVAKIMPPGGGWMSSIIKKEGLVLKVEITETRDKLKVQTVETLFDTSGRTKLISIAFPYKNRLYFGTHDPNSKYVASVPLNK